MFWGKSIRILIPEMSAVEKALFLLLRLFPNICNHIRLLLDRCYGIYNLGFQCSIFGIDIAKELLFVKCKFISAHSL